MADGYETQAVTAVHGMGDRLRDQRRRRGYPGGGGGQGHAVHDVASVLGMPASALSAETLAAITHLMEEIDHLRFELDQRESRQAWLEEMADQHAFLPVLNRRALMRELGRLLERSDESRVPATLVFFHVAGIERLKHAHGLEAGDAALRHVALVLGRSVRATDLVANIGGSDFALVLTIAEAEATRAKAFEIAQAVNAPPLAWNGQTVHLTVSLGIHPLSPGETAEHALSVADQACRMDKA